MYTRRRKTSAAQHTQSYIASTHVSWYTYVMPLTPDELKKLKSYKGTKGNRWKPCLSEEQVVKAARRYMAGETQANLSRELGVAIQTLNGRINALKEGK